MRRTSASPASLLLGTEPLWAVLVGLGLGGESLTPAGAVGAALVVVGTGWGQRIETAHRAGVAEIAASAAPTTGPNDPQTAEEAIR